MYQTMNDNARILDACMCPLDHEEWVTVKQVVFCVKFFLGDIKTTYTGGCIDSIIKMALFM